MQGTRRISEKKDEQLNASKRLIEEQEEEIMVNNDKAFNDTDIVLSVFSLIRPRVCKLNKGS